MPASDPVRRAASVALGLALALCALAGCGRPGPDPLTRGPVGPMVGHVDAHQAVVWYRPEDPGRYTLEVRGAGAQGPARSLTAESEASHDGVVTWEVADLEPATTYTYAIRDARGEPRAQASLRTAPAPGAPARVRLAIGSCAASEDQPVWGRILAAAPDAMVWLGDTPYIDSTQLVTARARHRAFLALPSLSELLRRVPLWSTWDDHDYGRDNADGTLEGKAASRQAYIEYRAQASYGADDEGIYTRVRYGPVEVFLLDARWFAGLERAASDPEAPSCLGHTQWAWLQEALRVSDAPFKLIASGMVWHDKGGRSQDDWATYAAERDALFAFLGEARVGGCVLLGGDVHACQHAVFEDTAAGYPLHELVVSPLHDRVWRGGDVRHAARRWGAVEKHVFLQLHADTTGPEPTLTATWTRADGKALHEVVLRAADLAGPAPR